MSTQENPLRPGFRERAKANDVPVARPIGFEAIEVADRQATVTLPAGPQHANPMGTLRGGILYDIADAAMGMAFASTLARPPRPATLFGAKRPSGSHPDAILTEYMRPIGLISIQILVRHD